MKTAVTLSGSIRKGSYNHLLQLHMGRKLREAGYEVTDLNLADYPMPIFNQDLEAEHTPEAAGQLAKMFAAADVVFIASPEHNAGASALIVNTISWVSRQKHDQWGHAVWGIGAVSAGKYGGIAGIQHLRDTLSKLGALLAPTLLGIGPSSSTFDTNGDPLEDSIKWKVGQMVKELTQFSRGNK